MINETEMWYLTPPSGIFRATWRKGRLFYTDRRIFWLHSFGTKQFEQSTDKIIGVTLEKRKIGPIRKSEFVIVLTFEKNGEKEEELFSTKVPMLKKWVELIRNNEFSK